MARSGAGALLTVQHHRAQLQLRAGALRDFVTLWPLWNGTEGAFGRLTTAAVPLVQAHHKLSATVAAAYYESLRAAERPGGSANAVIAEPPDETEIAGTMYLVGRDMTRRAIAAGQSPQAAILTALTRTSGTVGRLTLAGGRNTLTASAREDGRSAGTRRVLSGGSCDFCQMLAGLPASSDDFQAHDHCGCSAEPEFT